MIQGICLQQTPTPSQIVGLRAHATPHMCLMRWEGVTLGQITHALGIKHKSQNEYGVERPSAR